MLTKISKNLAIGDIEGCKRTNKDDCIIHSCKQPCFEAVVGKKIDKDHPNYIFYELEKDLFLNIIDPYEPLFYKETFDVALRFIEKNIREHKVVIHCNEGRSRSPQIAMLY